jgi:hypothetical protein
VPVLVVNIFDGSYWEIIRLSEVLAFESSFDLVYEGEGSPSPNWGFDLRIVDTPTDDDAAECGSFPIVGPEGWCTLSLEGLRKASRSCTCDFVTQILPYGCKCGGE